MIYPHHRRPWNVKGLVQLARVRDLSFHFWRLNLELLARVLNLFYQMVSGLSTRRP